MDMAVRVVDDLPQALEHIAQWGSGHSEAIVADSAAAIADFTAGVDAAAVLVNASTRFTDGGEFGFGAEIGISTQKLHARGPLGAARADLHHLRRDRQRPHSLREELLAPSADAVPPVLLGRGRREAAVRGRLPARRPDLDDGLPRRPAGQAAAGGGPGRHRQDRAGQGAGDGDRRGADPAAVLRGPRRGAGAVRVELQEAAAAHPGVAGHRRRGLEHRPRRHLRRGVPARPPAADGDPAHRADRAADRRDRQGRRRGRGPAAGGAVGLPGDHPGAGHRHRRPVGPWWC